MNKFEQNLKQNMKIYLKNMHSQLQVSSFRSVHSVFL